MGNVLGWLIGTTVGRWVGVVSIGALLVGGIIWLKVHDAKVREEERAVQADKQSQEIEKMRAADRTATERILNEATAKQEAAERRMQASLDREAGLVRTIASLGQQRAVVAGEVTRVADSELHGFNARSLGIRGPADTSIPCYLAAEERAIATAITQYPLCQKQVEATNAQVVEIKEQVTAQNEKIAAMGTKLDAVTGYASRLEQSYTVLYNLFPRKRRSAKCLWMFSCGRAKPLPVPAPIDLKGRP